MISARTFVTAVMLGVGAASPAFAFTDILAQKVASLRVMTSQFATASKAQINARVNLMQAQMGAIGVLASSVEKMEAFQSFSAVTGQGAQVCSAVAQRNDIDVISLGRNNYSFVSGVRGGQSSTPADNYEILRSAAQLDAYCTAEENNLGICRSKFDGMAGYSSNFNKLQTAEQLTTKQLEAAKDFVANMVPPPPKVVTASKNCDSACLSRRLASMQSDAAASMVATSMTMQMANQIGAKTFAEKK